jgi:hypothetical protein
LTTATFHGVLPIAMSKPSYKTREARPDRETMIKPGELIDFVEMSPLMKSDRRTYNLLIAHAWDRIDQPVTHVIAKSELQGLSLHESTDCIGDSVERLMAAIIRTYTEIDGKPAIQRTQLLGSTTVARAPDGKLYYSFSPEMRAIIRDSGIFARLHRDVILHLSSKYSLALYELCRKRVNLQYKSSEEFTVERFRELLGVEAGTLPAYKNLNQRVIRPAVAEVNFLCDVHCEIEPVLAGRKVVTLQKAIDETGEPLPSGRHYPSSRSTPGAENGTFRGCPVETWRTYFYSLKTGDRDTQKKAFAGR